MNIGTENIPYWKVLKEPCVKNVELVRTATPFTPLKRSSSAAFVETLNYFKVKDTNNNFLSNKHPISGVSSPFTFKNIKNIEDVYVYSIVINQYRSKDMTYLKLRLLLEDYYHQEVD